MSVALCFLLRRHPHTCAYWRRWRKCGDVSDFCVFFHCDDSGEEDGDDLVCGENCILADATRVKSVPTSWGGPGVVKAEAALYRHAFASQTTLCAVLLTDWCVPIYPPLHTKRRLTQHNLPLTRLMWSEMPTDVNRFRFKAELQKVVGREFAQVWCAAADPGPTRAELASHRRTVEQMKTKAFATGEQNCDEVTCIRRIIRKYGRAWLAAAVQQRPTTLSVFRTEQSHRAMKLNLNALSPRFFHDHDDFIFMRKVGANPCPTWYPLYPRQ